MVRQSSVNTFILCLVCVSFLNAQDFWPIPDCAWSISMNATSELRGVPIGGMGAGAFMYNFQEAP